jgi:iron complex transport system substrate-binding protein
MRARWGLLIGIVGLAAVLLFAACGDDDDGTSTASATATEEMSPTAEATAAPTEEMTATPTEEATSEPSMASTEYPLTLRDLMGREVTIESAPQAIVTTSPSAIEMLYAAGGTAIARSETSVHPEGVESLPSIGPAYQPSFESIIAQAPDLVIADASAQGHLAEAFEQSLAGTPILFVGALGYDDVAASIRLLGQVVDHQAEAEASAAAMESTLAEVQAATEGMPAPRVLIMNGAIDDFFVALPNSFVGDLVAKVGGDNVAAGEPESGPYPGYTQLSLETIAEKDPEVILTITAGGPSLADLVLGAESFADTAAVQDARVYDIDLEIFLQAPGPRAAEGLRDLARLLYGIE